MTNKHIASSKAFQLYQMCRGAYNMGVLQPSRIQTNLHLSWYVYYFLSFPLPPAPGVVAEIYE
jgi:hypothetical protein